MAPEALRWAASVSTVLAALLVAWRGPPRLTALGFLLFVAASSCWIAAALLGGRDPLLLQNTALLAVNLFGLARWGRAARRDLRLAKGARTRRPPAREPVSDRRR